MKDIWSYFSLHAQCIQCKLDISVQYGSFSILLSHLQLEHNIILDDGSLEQKEDFLREAFDEEKILFKTEDDSESELVDNFDQEGNYEGSKPIGIQILKLKKEDEDTEEFLEEIYGEDEGNSAESDNDEDVDAIIEECSGDSSNQLAVKKRGKQLIFNKSAYFDESTEDGGLICKFCPERFPENLSDSTRMRKLKKHLLLKHQDKLNSSMAQFLTKQCDRSKEYNPQYKQREVVFNKFDHFDQSKSL